MTSESADRWRRGLPLELQYWDSWLKSEGRQWADDPDAAHAEFLARFDPMTPLQDNLCQLLRTPESGKCVILDVGAGPATSVGKMWPGRAVVLHAIDPLGNDYNRLLDLYRLIPPVRTYCQEGESLIDERPPSVACFDLVYMRNALDHSIDPMRVVRGMLNVVKPGGVVYLLHHIREADTRCREGLHQWNLWADSCHYWMETDGQPRIDLVHETHELVDSCSVSTIGNDVEVILRRRIAATNPYSDK